LLLSLLSCRPIIAIGWTEIVIIVVLVAVLLGPLLFRIYRFIDRVQRASKEEKKK
jgi:Sec-independent protein translocase protein TatA